jgi:hypothetical protein
MTTPADLPASLRRFYVEIAPLLSGAIDGAELERRLGPSPSGADQLDFYRILLGRNVDRILRELFPTVHGLVEREQPGTWSALVRDYAGYARERSAGPLRDPNRYGLGFSDFLAERRTADPSCPRVLEQLADWHMCRYLAAVAPDQPEPGEDPDGFEQRVFVRGYSHPIPSFVRALARDKHATIPEPRATTVLIYRSEREPRPVRAHAPTLAQLGALARRQGLAPSGVLASLPELALSEAHAQLLALGILR